MKNLKRKSLAALLLALVMAVGPVSLKSSKSADNGESLGVLASAKIACGGRCHYRAHWRRCCGWGGYPYYRGYGYGHYNHGYYGHPYYY